MDNFPNSNNQNNNSDPSTARNVPPPPPPPIAIRTMDSDIRSIQQSGGAAPVPQMLNVNQPEKKPEPVTDVKINVPGYEGPEEKMFTPETLPSSSVARGVDMMKKGASSRMILYIVIFVIVAAGLGVAGYFLYPVFFVTPVPVTPPPAATTPPPPPAPISITHNSLITSDGATPPVLSLSQVTAPATSSTKPTIKEVILQDANGNQPAFSKYFASIVTEFGGGDLGSIFDDDFTTFIYYDSKGAWPGYVAKLKSGVPSAVAQNTVGKMEGYQTIANFYSNFVNPGEKSAAGFKSGQINGVPSRYLSFTTPGAALNYAFVGNSYFLVTTNYAGALEASKRLITTTP